MVDTAWTGPYATDWVHPRVWIGQKNVVRGGRGAPRKGGRLPVCPPCSGLGDTAPVSPPRGLPGGSDSPPHKLTYQALYRYRMSDALLTILQHIVLLACFLVSGALLLDSVLGSVVPAVGQSQSAQAAARLSARQTTRHIVVRDDRTDSKKNRQIGYTILAPPPSNIGDSRRTSILGIVLGCNDYTSARMSSLKGCIPDAAMFAHILRCMGASLVVSSCGDREFAS